MFARPTSIAVRRRAFIETKLVVGGCLGEGGDAGVTKPLVPQIGGDGGGEAVMRADERVKVAGGITSEKNRPGGQILDRKAIRVKFNRDRIITSECTYGN